MGFVQLQVRSLTKKPLTINLTQLYVLVIRHDEDDIGTDIAAVALCPPPKTLTPCGCG